MSAAAALNGTTDTKWTILNGSMKGSVRLLTVTAFSIGRSPDNDIVVVDDPKCSRKHATVEWTGSGCEITAISDANPIEINGEEKMRAVLEAGDVVTFG